MKQRGENEKEPEVLGSPSAVSGTTFSGNFTRHSEGRPTWAMAGLFKGKHDQGGAKTTDLQQTPNGGGSCLVVIEWFDFKDLETSERMRHSWDEYSEGKKRK